MIRTLRASFLSRALREKLLLVAFIGIGVLWWLSAFTTRASTFWRAQRATTAQLTEQNTWIRNRAQIEQSAQRAAAQLEASKTLNANQLAATVRQLADEAGLKNFTSSGQPQTTPGTQFALHSASFMIRNAEWEAVKKFYSALQQRAPYIAVDIFNLQSTPNNQAQLSLSLRVESVEIVR